MYRIVAVTREDPAYGFSLTGIDTIVCSTANEAIAAVRSVEADVGIVVIDGYFLENADTRMKTELERQTKPLVVSLPFGMIWRPEPRLEADDVIARLIRHAVGYQLNIHL